MQGSPSHYPCMKITYKQPGEVMTFVKEYALQAQVGWHAVVFPSPCHLHYSTTQAVAARVTPSKHFLTQWQIGRVKGLLQGSDGAVRGASLCV